MTSPYVPTTLGTPIFNPSAGGAGAANPLPYLSNSQYTFAPTAMDVRNLVPGGSPSDMARSLADTLLRASKWADNICFGADQAAKGTSLAASLSVESSFTTVKKGQLRLVCDYRPIVQVLGIDVGMSPGALSSIGPAVAAQTRIGRRTIYVPLMSSVVTDRPGATMAFVPSIAGPVGRLYAVWSYVNGYPHTQLAADVAAGATSCVVQSTDGNGGLWGVFPGTQLTVYDGADTETVTVTGVTLGTTTTTLATSAFSFAHTVPSSPDFLPVTGIPGDVQQAVISLATMLVKTRGARAAVMPQVPGGRPSGQGLAQAGALEDWEIANMLLTPYRVRVKIKGN